MSKKKRRAESSKTVILGVAAKVKEQKRSRAKSSKTVILEVVVTKFENKTESQLF